MKTQYIIQTILQLHTELTENMYKLILLDKRESTNGGTQRKHAMRKEE